ncbi:MAG TPA: hypothetical protein VGH19_21070 [Verrucomicrobiae bacterium]
MAFWLVLAQFQWLAPLSFAGFAWIDGEHHVDLGMSADGYQMVLSHEAHVARGSQYSCYHQHCLMDKLLVAFANPASSKEADHSFSFHNLDQSEDSKHLKAPAEASSPEIPLSALFFFMETPAPLMAMNLRPHLHPFTRPPPASIVDSTFIRHTVLII